MIVFTLLFIISIILSTLATKFNTKVSKVSLVVFLKFLLSVIVLCKCLRNCKFDFSKSELLARKSSFLFLLYHILFRKTFSKYYYFAKNMNMSKKILFYNSFEHLLEIFCQIFLQLFTNNGTIYLAQNLC